jgi:pSer/pThr/pTyr-binding forkhead associated (FHA) protein
MVQVTLRVLDGPDRGRVFEEVPTPITIGREEGNSVQLNDERVSRFHLKIQEDENCIVLTDLESTNGTKVNGETVQLWVLRAGDIIQAGRTVLLCGSRDDIARRLAELRKADLTSGIPLQAEEVDQSGNSISLEFELNCSDSVAAQAALHTLMPPPLPAHLSPSQAAQLAELLQFLHLRIRGLIQSVRQDKKKVKAERVTLEQRTWQNLVDIEDRLANYLRSIGEPEV